MIDKEQIAAIIRANDSEQHQIEYWRRRGVNIDGLSYVAEQRAMRVVMRDKGMRTDPDHATVDAFTDAEVEQIVKYMGMWLDAFAAGLEAGRRYPVEAV